MQRKFVTIITAAICSTAVYAAPLKKMESGHITTTAYVNGQGPFNFILDTAASNSVVYPIMREKLGLKGMDSAAGRTHGASGTQTFQLFPLDNIEVDGRKRSNLITVGLAFPGSGEQPGGIIGADVISHYLAEFDIPGNQFKLHDAGTKLPGTWKKIPIQINQARFAILEGTLNGKPVTMVLDTGARHTIMNWAAAEQAGVKPGDPGVKVNPVAAMGATSHAVQTASAGFKTLSAGPIALDAKSIDIADLPVFQALGLAGKPAMILGIEKLGNLHFAVDYAKGQLLVRKSK